MTDTTVSQSPSEQAVQNDAVRPRYHVEGQTSQFGPRWQIWDGERHYARFRCIASQEDADAICAELNLLATPPAPVEGVGNTD